MLKDPASKECLFRDHEKLGNVWKSDLSSTQVSHNQAEYALFSLIHLFDQYMTQVWTDSQNMLQSSNNHRDSLPPRDEAFSLNILGLQLMKQSLRTRKEFLYLVSQLQNPSKINHEPSDFTTIDDPWTQEDVVETKAQNIDTHQRLSNSSLISSSVCNRPFRLTRSPSSPTIESNWSVAKEEPVCSHNFKPACNYLLYYSLNTETRQSNPLSCHFCKQNIALKRSLSADNLNDLLNSDSEDDQDQDSYLEDIEGGIMRLNSDCGEDLEEIDQETRMMTSKLLIEEDNISSSGDNHCIEKLQRYNLIDTYEESSKIELDSLESDISSSLASPSSPSSYFSVNQDKEAVRAFENDIQCCELDLGRQKSASIYTPLSSYSGDISSSSMSTATCKSAPQKIDGVTKKQGKLIGFLNSSRLKEEPNKSTVLKNARSHSSFSITRSLTKKKVGLCRIFSSRKVNNK